MDEIKKTVGIDPDQIVVDAGFTTREGILAADERGIDLIGSFPDSRRIRDVPPQPGHCGSLLAGEVPFRQREKLLCLP